MVWCMTTRHGLCTISKNFNKNSEKKIYIYIYVVEKKKWQQPNMRILSCQSSLTGYTMTTTTAAVLLCTATATRNENKLNASISNFYALFFMFKLNFQQTQKKKQQESNYFWSEVKCKPSTHEIPKWSEHFPQFYLNEKTGWVLRACVCVCVWMSNEHITIHFQRCGKNYFSDSHYLKHARHFIFVVIFIAFFCDCSSRLPSSSTFVSLCYYQHLIRNKFLVFIFNSTLIVYVLMVLFRWFQVSSFFVCIAFCLNSVFFFSPHTLYELVKILTTNHLF